jgi:hypothetical protein
MHRHDADGEVPEALRVVAHDRAVAVALDDDGARHAQITIPIDRTPCSFGCALAWWRCPLCGRRIALLYLLNAIACRQCLGLVYAAAPSMR